MPDNESLLIPSTKKRQEVTGLQKIREILDECVAKEVPCQLNIPGSGNVKEHFLSDFHRSELHYRLTSLKLPSEYSVVILGTSIKPRYAVSFSAEDVFNLILIPHLGKTLVQIFLKS